MTWAAMLPGKKKKKKKDKDKTPKAELEALADGGIPSDVSGLFAEAFSSTPLESGPASTGLAVEHRFVGNVPEGSALSRAQIGERIACSREPSRFSLGSTPDAVDISLRYAFVCFRGYYPDALHKANQDAFKISSSAYVNNSSCKDHASETYCIHTVLFF